MSRQRKNIYTFEYFPQPTASAKRIQTSGETEEEAREYLARTLRGGKIGRLLNIVYREGEVKC